MSEYTWVPTRSGLPEWRLLREGQEVARIITVVRTSKGRQKLSWLLIAKKRKRQGSAPEALQRELGLLFASEPVPPSPWEAHPRLRRIAGTRSWRKWDRWEPRDTRHWVRIYPIMFTGGPVGVRLVEEMA